jgi:Tol biopolymer transport system component
MGEVYRARDTRLEREVALKVLPEALVRDEEHLARFRREAKILASLNHPNVATIHGFDRVGDVHFLVLELVPGETLQERIARGLSVAEALRIARAIAAGVEAAHEAGVVHRDLKPANIVLRPDGAVKILDFGLAKQTEIGGGAGDEGPVTSAFRVMGTPGYLSPEQALGEAADKRADVWAFGCILFECLAGARAFPGRTVSESIKAIFERSPDLESLPAETPPTVRLLVSRCLAKDSKQRLRDIADVKLLLEDAADQPRVPRFGVLRGRRWGGGVLIGSVAAVIVAAGAWTAILVGGSNREDAPVRVGTRTLATPLGTELGWRETSAALSKLGRGSPLLAISPDGERVAYCAQHGDRSAIYVHDPAEPEPQRLPGTEMGRAPFFSPDGAQVGFLAPENTIEIVSVAGGAPQEVHRLPAPSPNFTACWIGQSILYSTRNGLRLVPIRGGDPKRLTDPDDDPDEHEHLAPFALPDAEHVLFTVALGHGSRVEMLSLSTLERRTVLDAGGSARWVDGWLVYARGSDVQRVSFDPKAPDVRGLSQPLQERVFTTPCAGGGSAITHFDVARDGTLAYAPAPATRTQSAAYWVDRNSEGVGVELARGEGDWKHPRLAPSGDRFALDVLQDSGAKDVHLFVFGLRFVGNQTHDGMSIMSAWTPDGALTVRSTHRSALCIVSSAGEQELLAGSESISGILYADSWTPDGRTLVVTRKVGGGSTLWSYAREGGTSKALWTSRDEGRFGQVSPDGRWLAYVADVGNEPEVWVRPFDPIGERYKVSLRGGGAPMWSEDGRELFYREPDGTVVAATFATEPGFEVRERKRLFRNDYDADPDGHQHYDVSDDGQRFLMIKNEYSAPNRVHLVAGVVLGVD